MGLAQGCNEVHEQKKLPMIRLQKEGEDQSREAAAEPAIASTYVPGSRAVNATHRFAPWKTFFFLSIDGLLHFHA